MADARPNSTASDWNLAFAKAISTCEGQIDVAHAALLFACEVYPDLDIDGYLGRLDDMAEAVLSRLDHNHPITTLNDVLFGELGFHGNTDDYFDPRNKKISLHPAPPPEQADEAKQKIGRYAIVKAQVAKIESSGLVMRVLGVTGRTARGFVPAGQTGTARGTDLRKAFKLGSVLDVKIIDVDPKRGEPRLSIRAFKEDEERRAHKEYRQKVKAESSFGTLGDLLRKKLNLSASADKPEE